MSVSVGDDMMTDLNADQVSPNIPSRTPDPARLLEILASNSCGNCAISCAIRTGEEAIARRLKKANEWSFRRLNFILGCKRVSEGCDYCYICRAPMRWHYQKAMGSNNLFEGRVLYLDEKRQLAKLKNVPFNSPVFVNGHGDTFAEFIPDEKREHWHSLFEEMPQWQFLLLTKRPGLMELYYRSHRVPRNVWVGTTIENRKGLFRLDHLKKIDAPVRFVSFEPLLEDLGDADLKGIHWAPTGGETDPYGRARLFDVQWARNLRTICERDGVAFFYEGGNGRSDNHRVGGNLLEGKVCQNYPVFKRY